MPVCRVVPLGTKVATAACLKVDDPLPGSRQARWQIGGGVPYSFPRCVWSSINLPGNARLRGAGRQTH